MESIGAFVGAIFAALCKTGDFFGASFFPEDAVFAFEEMAVFFQFTGVGVEDGIEGLVEDCGRIGSALDFGGNQLLELGWQLDSGECNRVIGL